MASFDSVGCKKSENVINITREESQNSVCTLCENFKK